MPRTRSWSTLCVALLCVSAVTAIQFTVEDDRDASVRFPLQTDRIVAAYPALVLMETGEWVQVDPMKKALLGQQKSPTDVGVKDPASDDQFKHLKLGSTDARDAIYDFFPWKQDKKKFIGATTAETPDDINNHKKPQVDRASEQSADPSTIHRECPRKRCPKSVKCADETHICCGTGNFTMCCPGGTTCLNTDPPSCLKEPVDDPKACTTEECDEAHHCPLSKVAACCMGGRTCCPANAKCTMQNPPTCKLLSHWEMLTQRPPSPEAVVKAQGPDDTPFFAREPIKLVSVMATEAPTSAPTAAPTAAPTPPPQPLNRTLADECQICKDSLFPDTPSTVGVRSREKSEIIGNKRVTITEVQKTIMLRDGGLRTKSTRHRVVVDLSSGIKTLWPENDDGSTLAQAIHRLHKAQANPTKEEVAASKLAPFMPGADQAGQGNPFGPKASATLTQPSTMKHTQKQAEAAKKSVQDIVKAAQTVAKEQIQNLRIKNAAPGATSPGQVLAAQKQEKAEEKAVEDATNAVIHAVTTATETATSSETILSHTSENNVKVATNAAEAAAVAAGEVAKSPKALNVKNFGGTKAAQRLVDKLNDRNVKKYHKREYKTVKVPDTGGTFDIKVKVPLPRRQKKTKGQKRRAAARAAAKRQYVGGLSNGVGLDGKTVLGVHGAAKKIAKQLEKALPKVHKMKSLRKKKTKQTKRHKHKHKNNAIHRKQLERAKKHKHRQKNAKAKERHQKRVRKRNLARKKAKQAAARARKAALRAKHTKEKAKKLKLKQAAARRRRAKTKLKNAADKMKKKAERHLKQARRARARLEKNRKRVKKLARQKSERRRKQRNKSTKRVIKRRTFPQHKLRRKRKGRHVSKPKPKPKIRQPLRMRKRPRRRRWRW